MKLEFALRDEKINIFSMIFRKQLVLCKSEKFKENRLGPYLLDCKKSNTIFKISEIGKIYENRIREVILPLKYVAFIDSQIKIKVTDSIFQVLCSEKFFNLWNKNAPLKFFRDKGNIEGYLIAFRIFEIDREIHELSLEKGRKGRNFYYKLKEPEEINLLKPIISNFDFSLEKEELINLLKKRDVLIEVNDSKLNLSFEKEVDYEYQVLHSEVLSEEFIKKIPKQRNINSTSWERNPKLAKSILVKNGYKCQFNEEHRSFISQVTNKNYVEAHHLIPMEFQGEFQNNLDIPENIVTLCPNCHKQVHLGNSKAKKEILESLLFQKSKELLSVGIEIEYKELIDYYGIK